jgi:hypothetical protein
MSERKHDDDYQKIKVQQDVIYSDKNFTSFTSEKLNPSKIPLPRSLVVQYMTQRKTTKDLPSSL